MSNDEHNSGTPSTPDKGTGADSPQVSTPYRKIIEKIAPSTIKRRKATEPAEPLSPGVPSENGSPEKESRGWWSRLKRRYEVMVLSHLEGSAQFESIATSALFCMPGHLRDTSAEFAYAAIRLISLLNDRIVLKFKVKPTRIEQGGAILECASVLGTVQLIELFIEIVTQRMQGERARWSVITVIEFFKCCVRLFMLRRTGGQMLTFQAIPGRSAYQIDEKAVDRRLNALIDNNGASRDNDDANDNDVDDKQFKSPHRKTLREALLERAKQNKTANNGKQKSASSSSSSSSSSFMALDADSETFMCTVGELIWITQPLITLLAVKRFGLRSWYSWLCAVLLDLLSRAVHENDASRPRLTADEKSELRRRSLSMALYLFRWPMYDHVANAASHIPTGPLGRIGFLRTIGGVIGAYLATYPQRYFYTSTR